MPSILAVEAGKAERLGLAAEVRAASGPDVRVLRAGDVTEALDALAREPVDAAVLELAAPYAPGLESPRGRITVHHETRQPSGGLLVVEHAVRARPRPAVVIVTALPPAHPDVAEAAIL
ncbi:MAG TPA: hypothetical protein VHH36_04595, partial [Candidatus Thermoplasmatota archaeon]|nr:hypothetical protein [Candidatus Thermoplasmatota archaeon]